MKIFRILGLIIAGRFDYLWYSIKIRLLGLDLCGTSAEELGLSVERSNMHANSGGPVLRKVLRTIGIRPGSRILDFGSGKGGALFTFTEFPFAEIVGVEISSILVDIARANAEQLGISNIQLVRCDAGSFDDLDRFTHIYMFNPFPTKVMKEVMSNIAASLRRQPRKLTIILKCPETVESLLGDCLFQAPIIIKFAFSHPFFIYIHDPDKYKTLDVVRAAV